MEEKSDKEKKGKALRYHSKNPKGKITTKVTKPCSTAEELSLAYTPEVAWPCREIEKNEKRVYKYTNKENSVAVISNGTAVLGLGNIGATASKPVMEGKAVLFKKFADVDATDLLIDSKQVEEIINISEKISKTYGGINLEDIKAPDCFRIEKELKERTDIPIFHDDQHGTAIISGAGLLNALELTGKNINEIKVVFCGAGAAGIATARFYNSLGVKKENMIMVDSKGIIHNKRENINEYKREFAVNLGDWNLKKNAGLEEAIVNKDVFVGVSIGGLLNRKMLKSMADQPIVFAMANPDPEIGYDLAKNIKEDVIMATGRSDYPNQINNVLGFPFIFRGALDTRAREINKEMKIAASGALAKVAKMPITNQVKKAYDGKEFSFGPDYIVPKPFDKRVAIEESLAVAKAAIETGVARKEIDLDKYRKELEMRLGS